MHDAKPRLHRVARCWTRLPWRCAGFFFAIKAETTTGESVFAQLLTGGFPAAAAVILAVTVASFAPAIIRQVGASRQVTDQLLS